MCRPPWQPLLKLLKGEEEIEAGDHQEGVLNQICPNIMIIVYFVSFLNCTNIIEIFMILYYNYLWIEWILWWYVV